MSSEIESALAKVWGKKNGDTNQAQQLLGTAFFISPTLLVTCKHVVETLASNHNLYIKFIGEHAPQLVDYQCHPDFDLAVLTLQSNSHSGPVIPLAEQDRRTIPEKGMMSTACGFRPDTHACDNNKGDIGVYSEQHEKLTFYPKVPFGFSGGPLLDETNHCIGVTIAKSSDTECSYAEPIYRIYDWLQELGIDIKKPVLAPWQNHYLNDLITSMELLKTDSMLQSVTSNDSAPDIQNNHIKLSAVYSPLCVDRQLLKKQEQEQDNNSPIYAIDVVAQAKNIVLRGDPGCGKTTFTRYWALRLASELVGNNNFDDAEESVPDELKFGFPIHIELDNLYSRISEVDLKTSNLSVRSIEDAIKQVLEDDYLDFSSLEAINSDANTENNVVWFFDGLDEIRIDDSLRIKFLEGFNRWAQRLGQNNRVCLTSRPYAYENTGIMNRFQTVNFIDLTPDHCIDFIKKYFNQLESIAYSGSQHSVERLIELLEEPDREHLLHLCLNPLLASLTCVIYFIGGESALPKDRAGLYEKCIELVFNRWEDKHKNPDYSIATLQPGSPIANGKILPRSLLLENLRQLAFYAHLNLSQVSDELRGHGDISYDLLERYFLSGLLRDKETIEKGITETDIKDYLYRHTGVLLDRSNDCYAFMHRTFREYLAAEFIQQNDKLHVQQVFLTSFNTDAYWWQEVLALLVMLYQKSMSNEKSTRHTATQLLLQCLPLTEKEVNVASNYHNNFVTQLIDNALVCANAECEVSEQATTGDLHIALRQRLINWMLAIISVPEIQATTRHKAGLLLGKLGDPRPGVGTIIVNQTEELPDIQWADIPASTEPIQLENTDKTFEIKQPFKLAIYPVTNVQFQTFIKHTEGYNNPQWWQGFESKLEQPKASTWEDSNSPRADVSWFEAMAFCRWLTACYKSAGILPFGNGEIRLPREWEWQQAATSGIATREYSWNPDLGYCDHEMANIKSHIGRISSVGIYPNNRSEQGVFDLAGNVWEWCFNGYDSLKLDLKNGLRTTRGGAWGSSANLARAAARGGDRPNLRDDYVGFRLLCCPP